MKTKAWKRIGALVLALALIVSGVPQMCIEALADDTTTVTNEFTVTGLNASTEVYNGGTHWRIVLNYEGTFDIGGTWGKDVYYGWLNHNIDDVPGGGNIQCYQSSTSTENSSFTLQFSSSVIPTDGTANCKLTLKGGTWSKAGKSGTVYNSTMMEDVDIYFNQYGVSLGEPIKDADTSDVYIKDIVQNTNSYIWFRMSDVDTIERSEAGDEKDGAKKVRLSAATTGLVDGAWYYENNSGIWIDSKRVCGMDTTNPTNIELYKMEQLFYPYEDSYYRVHQQWYTINDGSRITIQGRFTEGGQSVNIETSVLECQKAADGTQTWIILPRLTSLAEGTTVQDGAWKISMNYVGTLDCNDGETFTAKAMIGDEEIDVTISTDGTNIIITPPADKVPTDGTEVTMTLKAGDIIGTAGSKSMIVSDVTFHINKYGLSLDEPIEAPDTTEMYIQRVQQNSNGYLWFAMSKNDTVTKGSVLASVAGGILDGKYYHDTNSGIWINGVWEDDTTVPEDIHFFKTTENLNPATDNYYRVHQQWYNIVNGSRIKMQGIFEASDGNTIEVETSVMECQKSEDGTQKWILLPRLLDLAKTPIVEGGKWKIAMNYVGTLVGEDGEVFAGKAYIGETEYDVAIYREGDAIVLEPEAESLPTDGTEAILTLKAGDILGDKGNKSMIVNDVTICVNKYGVSLDEPIPSYTIVENKLNPMTTYEDKTWNIYMKQSGSFLGKTEETFEFDATIAGTEGKVTVYATKVDGTVYFNPVIPDSNALKPSEGNVSVVIKAGVVSGSEGTENELKQDVVLYFDKNGLSTTGSSGEYGEVTPNVKLALTSPYTWDTGIYFKVSKADNIVGDSSWNVRPRSLSGFVDGVCYRGDGGIYITDTEGNTTKYSPNTAVRGVPSFVKIGNYGTETMVYYLGINSSQTVEVGTKVEIKGVFAWDGQLAEIASTILQWNGSEWLNITPADVENIKLTLSEGNADYIDLKTTDDMVFSTAAFFDAMPGAENGVYYNGVRTSTQLWRNSNTSAVHDYYRVLLYGQDIEAQVGDEVVIKGRFTTNCHIVHFVEQAWVFDGSKWTESVLPIKVQLKDTADGDSATSLGFTVKPEEDLAYGATQLYNFTTGGIYVNGKYSTAAYLYKVGEKLYKIDLSGHTTSFEVGDIVTIDGTVESNGIIVEYQYTVFTYQGNGVWTLTTSKAPEEPIRFELDMQSSKRTEKGWELLLKATDGLRGDPGVVSDATYTGLTLFVNGTEYSSDTLLFKNSDSYYEMIIPESVIPTTGTDYKIIIKKGMITGGWEESGRYMEKEMILYVSGDRISDKGTPVGTEDVSISCSGGTSKTVKFLLSGTDAMLVNTTSGTGIYAANDTNSGVFINGVKKSNVALYKYEESGNTYYQADFSSITYTPTSGDVVLINGTFELSNYYVVFESVAAKWNGSAWEAITDVSAIELNPATCDAADDAFIIDPEGTTVNAETVKAGKVLYKAGTYTIVYSIGSAKMTQLLTITNTYSATAKNGAGKAEAYKNPTLPDMVTGEANAAGNYINQVVATEHGTTVISMDGAGTYKSKSDFDNYGLDYVVDLGIGDGRDIKVLQLSDTQTIDSEQQRYSGRISPTLAAQTVPEKQFENLQYYVNKVVEVSKPDIILIAGDLIYTEFDDDGSMWLDLIEYMDSLQIPWAPIFGNHDQESIMGVEWQCEQMMKSTYCLFNRRHEGVGGNCNYSIGLARNGKLEKAIYMLDSNGCGNVAKSGNTYSTWGYNDAGEMTQVRAASGFYDTQIDWYRKTAMRVNEVAGDIIPSVQCYHIGTEEVLLAARAAGYQYGEENAAQKYGMNNDVEAESYLEAGKTLYTVKAQSGDSGYKMGGFSNLHRETGLLEIMNAVGTNGVFLGHNHSINTSMSYGGVRWTYGLKTGIYADDTVNKGGTLINMDADSENFTLEQIQVELEYSEPSLTVTKNKETVYAGESTRDTIYVFSNALRDAMAVQDDALVVTEDEESGVFINAVKSDAKLYKSEADVYKIVLPAAPQINDVVSLYGIFENSTGDHAVYFQKTLVVQWDGTQWKAVKVDWLNGSSVQVNATGADYEKAMSYLLTDLGFLPYSTAEFPYELDEAGKIKLDDCGNKLTKKNMLESVSTYGDNVVYCKLDNVVYTKTIALYIPGDSHVDEKVNVLDLVAMKKAEKGEEPTTATEKYADQLGSKKLREKLVGK